MQSRFRKCSAALLAPPILPSIERAWASNTEFEPSANDAERI
jgi:hypothetical protein